VNFVQRLGRILGDLLRRRGTQAIELPSKVTIEQALRPAYASEEAFEFSKELARKALKERLPYFPIYDVDKDLQKTFELSTLPKSYFPGRATGMYDAEANAAWIWKGMSPEQTYKTVAHEGTHALFRDAIRTRNVLTQGSLPKLPPEIMERLEYIVSPIVERNPVRFVTYSKNLPIPFKVPDSFWTTYLGTRLELDPLLAEFKRRLIHDKVLNASSTYRDVLAAARRYKGGLYQTEETLIPAILTRLPRQEKDILAKRLLQLLGIGGAAAVPAYALTRGNQT